MPTQRQHLAIRVLDNFYDILETRDNIKVNTQWVLGHTEVVGNEIADKCARSAAELPLGSGDSFTSTAFIKRRTQQPGLREWQKTPQSSKRGPGYCSVARRQPLWCPT